MAKTPNPQDDLVLRIAAALRSLRKDRRLTQETVAERMGLSSSAQPLIGDYENARKIPRADQLLRFLQAVDSSPADFGKRLTQSSTRSAPRLRHLLRELAVLRRRLS